MHSTVFQMLSEFSISMSVCSSLIRLSENSFRFCVQIHWIWLQFRNYMNSMKSMPSMKCIELCINWSFPLLNLIILWNVELHVAFYAMNYAHFVVCMRKIVDKDCNVCFMFYMHEACTIFVVFGIQPNKISAWISRQADKKARLFEINCFAMSWHYLHWYFRINCKW